MNVIQISYNSKVIGTLNLIKPSLTVGRSPTCDFVLRSKGVRPVHFLIEWIGVGEFDAKNGSWSVFDISKTQEQTQVLMSDGARAVSDHSAEGVILTQDGVEIGKYRFQLGEEKLAATELNRRILKEVYFDEQSIVNQLSNNSNTFSALEIVDVHIPSDAIVDITHYPSIDKINNTVGRIKLKINWKKDNVDFVELVFPKSLISTSNEVKLFNKGEVITLDKHNYLLNPGDLFQLRVRNHDYFLRIVNWISIEKSKKQWLKDPIFKWMSAVLLFFFVFSYYLLNLTIEVEKKSPPPMRIAKVENIEVQPLKEIPKPAPAPVPPKSEDLLDKKPIEEIKSKPKQDKKIDKPEASAKAAASKVKRSPKKAVQAGLNSVAKKVDVNAVGLLGSVSNSKPNTISADQVLNDAVVNEIAESSGPSKVVVQQSASGILGEDVAVANSSKGDLVSASSTLSGVEVESTQSSGPLAIKGGDGKGLGLNLKGKLEKSLGQGQGVAEGNGFMESISGGLTKDEIRKALNEHRREIRSCYEKALLVSSKIAGRVSYKWHISPSGAVTSNKILKSELKLPQFEECVSGVIKGIQFPEASTGQPTTVIYPFVFQSGNGN